MYTYTNPDYEPQIHDFGDDYHKPDSEEELAGSSLMVKVKKIRRRYRDWFDYSDACILYDQYMESVIAKYGGKKAFKLALLLGQVNDYFPNYPELKKTRKNRFYAKNNIARMIETKTPFSEDDHSENIIDALIIKSPKVSIKFSDSEKMVDLSDSHNGGYNQDQIATITNEIGMLQGYFIDKVERINRVKNKKRKRHLKRALNRQSMRMALNYRSLSDMEKIYDQEHYNKFMGLDPNGDTYINYKGAMYTASQCEQLLIHDQLKAIGVRINKINRRRLKVVRSKKNKKHKKHKRNVEDKWVKDFTGDEYDDWVDFQDDMMNMTGTGRRFN